VNAKSSGSGIEGLAFAIPSNTAVQVIQDLMQYGYVRGRVLLGITLLAVTDQYTLYRYNLKEYGVYISKVTAGSDAEKAGLKSADRLVSIDGTEVDSSATARKLIQAHKVGDKVTIIVSRDGNPVTFEITLTEYIPNNTTLS
jgi:serine protease Do